MNDPVSIRRCDSPKSSTRNSLRAFRLAGPAVLALVATLTACAGDLDPRYEKMVATGTGGGTGTGGSGTGGSPGGTGGMTGGGTGGMTAAACDAFNTVIKPTCGVPGCHAGTFPPDLSTEANVKAVVGMTGVANCASYPSKFLISATAPAAGVIIERVSGNGCGPGTLMPFGASTGIPAADVACIKSYFMSLLK